MPPKKRQLNRAENPFRDASLIIVASEDRYAVKQYFARFRAKRVQVIVLETEDGRSSPGALQHRIDEFVRKTKTEEGDELWLCFDSDHWIEPGHSQNLNAVLAHCHKQGYSVAISNPCFELWLLLHFEDHDGKSPATCEEVSARLKKIMGGYNKAKCCGSAQLTKAHVLSAIERARKLDNGEEGLPTSPTTRVHLILERMQARSAIEFE